MKMYLRYLLLTLVAVMGLQATAAVPSGYYDNAKNKSNKALMTALHTIIKGHTKRSYQQLGGSERKPVIDVDKLDVIPLGLRDRQIAGGRDTAVLLVYRNDSLVLFGIFAYDLK